VIEIMTFQLRPGADVEAFLAADRRVQTEVAYQSPGLLRRTLARADDRWLVLKIWANLQACDDGAHAFATSALGANFMSYVEPSTLSIDRYGDVD
jgi:hypothetical protein